MKISIENIYIYNASSQGSLKNQSNLYSNFLLFRSRACKRDPKMLSQQL